MKTLPLAREGRGRDPLPAARKGWSPSRSPTTSAPRIEAVIPALGDRLKVFSDILKLGRYFFTETLDATTPTP